VSPLLRLPAARLAAVTVLAAGCASAGERAARSALDAAATRAPAALESPLVPGQGSSAAKVGVEALARGLPGQLAWGMARSPGLAAAFERWRASVLRVTRARRWPEPNLGFGVFLSAIETRVGPQQARLSLSQSFPWPTRITAGADAAVAEARVLERRFDAEALMLARQIADGHWRLWQIRRTRLIHAEHLALLRSLSETVRARVETGAASFAEVQQIDLAAARLEDRLRGMDEEARGAEARLRASLGAPADVELPTPEAPPAPRLPDRTETATVPAGSGDGALADRARLHPRVEAVAAMAEASEARAEAEAAERLPSFTIGLDWILTGPASHVPTPADSGKDALVLGGGLRLPLWQGSYADAEAAARADARAFRAERRALADRAAAEAIAGLAALRDAARRVTVFRDVLVPQARATYDSVLGAYSSGRSPLSALLLAQRDVLELRVELEQARAEAARHQAELDEAVGRRPHSGSDPSGAPAALETP
jgi:cobalt-zinc-cadmium efflux system outer membrane protein